MWRRAPGGRADGSDLAAVHIDVTLSQRRTPFQAPAPTGRTGEEPVAYRGTPTIAWAEVAVRKEEVAQVAVRPTPCRSA
ncbi:hypothetical protein GCM10023176_48050 [Micromonospora coerulea]|uniref:Uncharacterized protein n=1 Tax=Micromonospora coerulea TaxID=47856 RepID=A0ABP8SYQ5_9ACTN